jgi:hypothetical protein
MTEGLLLGFKCLTMYLTGSNPLTIAGGYVLVLICVLISSLFFWCKLLHILCCFWDFIFMWGVVMCLRCRVWSLHLAKLGLIF